MRNNTLMTVLFFVMLFGSLALHARCRPQLLDSSSSVATVINSSSLLDERKVTLIFCAKTTCNYFDPAYGICYCCPDASQKEYCHLTLEECRANCSSCTPKCS
ncbi:unnamed protein product [Urochloa decumbens]|uniref:Uncharacterized protein n=1 Tax=Urochloa decumbens TaxID=240449 RepID=A0ABC8ZAL0_9POAL